MALSEEVSDDGVMRKKDSKFDFDSSLLAVIWDFR